MFEKTFLVEIGTEELPSKSLRILAESFVKNFVIELKNASFMYEDIEWFATPRRIALKVKNVTISISKLKKQKLITATAVNTKDKKYNLVKNLTNCCKTIYRNNIFYKKIKDFFDKKDIWFFYCSALKKQNLEILFSNMVSISLSKLPIQKSMRWGESSVQFVRPVHTVTLLLNNKVIPTTILNIQSDRVIYGHRFMGESKLIIKRADQYPRVLLERGKVIANYEFRKAKIKTDIKAAACKIGGNVDLDENLLEEVTSLVEWPIVLTAKFEAKFLAIPMEVLIYIMKDSQKYFPIYADNGELLPNFIFVANIESSNPEKIISGNEKVFHSRLIDAESFFKIDRKKRLEDYLPYLQSILFQKKLGTLFDKTNRIIQLSKWIACKIGANSAYAARAALLSKCDLMTNMVFEFSHTQGVMGMYYARYDGEVEDVAIALNEQYQPRFAGDKLPSNLISSTLSIADKIDTLVGMFGISQHPKGNKDPFALRRAALGILRIIIKNKLNLDLQILIKRAVFLYGETLTNSHVVNDVINFILKRFCAWYQNKGYHMNIIQAVLARCPTHPIDFDARVQALSSFYSLQEETSLLIEMNKRIANVLLKFNEIPNKIICTSLLREAAEIKLANSLSILNDKSQEPFSISLYQKILADLVGLREEVNNFFEKVMINVNDKEIRINRLTLLHKLRELFLLVADLSLLR